MSKIDKRYFGLKYLVIACVWAGYSFFSSCTPDSGLGANILPENNTLNANFTDTSTVKTSIILEDSVNTTNVGSFFLGTYNDPVFGETKASIYAQISVPTNGANPFTVVGSPGSNTAKVILDSVVFAMPYVYTTPNYYGTLSPQTIQVYLLDNSLYPDTTYYSNQVISHKTLLGEKVVKPNVVLWDTTKFGPDTFTNYPRFRIKLNQQWGQKWLDTALSGVVYSGQGDSILLNEAAFIRHLPGLYITATSPMQLPGQGSIWYMNLYDAGSGVFFYMRIIDNLGNVTYSIPQFTISPNNVMFMHYDHDYKSTAFYAPHKPKVPISSPNNVYVQGLGGVITKIDFPYLSKQFSGKVIINRAEVDIPVESQFTGVYSPPAQMYLIGINDTSTVPSTSTFTLPDEYSNYYGGSYDAFDNVYQFDIAQYVQNILDGKTIEDGLYLVPGSSAITPDRVVAYGGGYPDSFTKLPANKRLRLKIYYTPLNGHKAEKMKTVEVPLETGPAKTVKALK